MGFLILDTLKQVHRHSSLSPEEFVNELKQIIVEPQRQYESVLVRLAIRRENEQLKVSFGVFRNI